MIMATSSTVLSGELRASIGITISPVEEEMHNRLLNSLVRNTGFWAARWSVSVALGRNMLHIRLVACVARDAKERGLKRRRLSEVK